MRVHRLSFAAKQKLFLCTFLGMFLRKTNTLKRIKSNHTELNEVYAMNEKQLLLNITNNLKSATKNEEKRKKKST